MTRAQKFQAIQVFKQKYYDSYKSYCQCSDKGMCLVCFAKMLFNQIESDYGMTMRNEPFPEDRPCMTVIENNYLYTMLDEKKKKAQEEHEAGFLREETLEITKMVLDDLMLAITQASYFKIPLSDMGALGRGDTDKVRLESVDKYRTDIIRGGEPVDAEVVTPEEPKQLEDGR